jgi:predicted metal-dependent HD superfamily phosphohydrolase
VKATLEQFADLWRRLGARGKPEIYFDILRAQYEEPPRAYHTLDHVGWGLKRIGEIITDAVPSLGCGQIATVEYALWFHDAIMVFGRESTVDERRSADMAVAIGIEVGLEPAFLRQARRLIMATAHMNEPALEDEALLVDADLSILGAPAEAFRDYEHRVRIEWSHVDEAAFRAGRLKVLDRFANKRRIFTTPYAYNRWERMARFNIGQSMAKLKSGAWP